MASIDQALKIIYNQSIFASSRLLPLENILGEVSSQDIFATLPNPRFNNSAMDGYGVRVEDAGKSIKIIQEIFAGDDKNCTIKSNQGIKITTGARVPDSIEAIIPQEDVQIDNDKIILPKKIIKNSHIRFIGEDVAIGDKILSSGETIKPSHIALLASQGVSYVNVFKKPQVAVLATGAELELHFKQIKPHQIYNSNAPHFYSRAKELGCNVEFISLIADELQDIKNGIKSSLYADLIITTGGVSVGEKDFVKEAFSELGGEFLFQKIDIKPGKPTVFGKIGSSLFLSLPGNPLAAASIFELFGTVIIRALKSQKNIYHKPIHTTLSQDIKIKKGKSTLIPGYFNGINFTPSNKRAPGMVSVLRDCNGFILTLDDVSLLKQSQEIKFLPFEFELSSDIELDIYSR